MSEQRTSNPLLAALEHVEDELSSLSGDDENYTLRQRREITAVENLLHDAIEAMRASVEPTPALAALEHVLKVFKSMADRGRYPIELLPTLEGEPNPHYLGKQGWEFLTDAIAQCRATVPPTVESFQQRVRPWLNECFGEEVARNRAERNHRFLEEALELVQSLGCTWEDARKLVDYVFSRDVGEPNQELGGVMVTLAALSFANSLDMNAAGETELARVWQKIDVIREKQARKVKDSALPGSTVTKSAEGS
jgi:hypothetical protein